jgi:hypothetical protein
VSWTVEILNRSVASELDDLPEDIRARFYRIVELLETFGLSQVREPHNKHLEDKLWEMRMKGAMVLREPFTSQLTGSDWWSFMPSSRKHPGPRAGHWNSPGGEPQKEGSNDHFGPQTS